MGIAQASCRTALEKKGSFSEFFSIGMNFLYYKIFSGKSRDACERFLIEGTPEKFVKFWNLPENNSIVRFFFKTMLPSVKVKQIIYVPKLLEPLTFEDLENKRVKLIENVSTDFIQLKGKYDPE